MRHKRITEDRPREVVSRAEPLPMEPVAPEVAPEVVAPAPTEPAPGPGFCPFCNETRRPTRDGKHKCQCRREPA